MCSPHTQQASLDLSWASQIAAHVLLKVPCGLDGADFDRQEEWARRKEIYGGMGEIAAWHLSSSTEHARYPHQSIRACSEPTCVNTLRLP